MIEVRFWNGEERQIGNMYTVATRAEADEIAETKMPEDCMSYDFYDTETQKWHEFYVEDIIDEWTNDDYGYEMNMPCDTYGPCACSSSCPNYIQCQG